MRVFISGILLAFALWAASGAWASRASESVIHQESYCEGEISVRLKPGRDINKVNSRHNTFVKEQIGGGDEYLLVLPADADHDKCLKLLQNDRDLYFAESNYNYKLPEVRQVSQAFIDQVSQAFIDGSSPASFYGQTSSLNINLAQAHRFGRGEGIRVAVIDTGLDFNHPLFSGRIAGPVYDFVDNDLLPNDERNGSGSGHGTFVAGLIALTAPGATIFPLRAFNRDGLGTSFNIAKAIRYATDNGAKVINMSFGLEKKDKMIEEALKYADDRAFLVASAGNENQDDIDYPAEEKGKTLSVTSTTDKDLKAPFANYNKDVAVSSPGVLLYSAYPGGRWARWSGTSFSTAIVTGQAAVLLSLDPQIKFKDLSKIIMDTGVDIDKLNKSYNNKLGKRVDFHAAIDKLRSKK
jgi:subtilisin family serine protease